MATVVLLSGGFDSAAALMRSQYYSRPELRALFFDYGQPALAREWKAAAAIADALRVSFEAVDISGAFRSLDVGFWRHESGPRLNGLDPAFVPVRNAVLLSVAASRALAQWPTEFTRLVVGFNAQDVSGFPDCGEAFRSALTTAINAGLAGSANPMRVAIDAPWSACTKRQIAEWVHRHDPAWLPLLARTWSCYRDDGPCGECTACRLRAEAL